MIPGREGAAGSPLCLPCRRWFAQRRGGSTPISWQRSLVHWGRSLGGGQGSPCCSQGRRLSHSDGNSAAWPVALPAVRDHRWADKGFVKARCWSPVWHFRHPLRAFPRDLSFIRLLALTGMLFRGNGQDALLQGEFLACYSFPRRDDFGLSSVGCRRSELLLESLMVNPPFSGGSDPQGYILQQSLSLMG